jgi:hypothetical protein
LFSAGIMASPMPTFSRPVTPVIGSQFSNRVVVLDPELPEHETLLDTIRTRKSNTHPTFMQVELVKGSTNL